MAKRGADSYLTDQNWEDDGDQQEAGTFVQADQNVIKHRQIRKAKRRNAGEPAVASSEGKSTAFKGFAGFTTSRAAPTFPFGSGMSKPIDSLQDNGVASPAKPTLASFKFGERSGMPSISNGAGKSNRAKYLQQLKTLNEGVAKWIKDHVDQNPYCILSPIFTDYATHLVQIENKYPDITPSSPTKPAKTEFKMTDSDIKNSTSPFKPAAPQFPVSTGGFTFSSDSTSPGMKKSASTPVFKVESASTPAFNVENGNGSAGPDKDVVSSSITNAFSFKSTAGSSLSGSFSFATAKPAATKPNGEAAGEDEEYVPPKAEISEVKEEGALYSKRCKLFYQKDGVWTEKGVGNLHLKKCNDKAQLIVRADTSLGNVLLNIMLSSTVPIKRQGKNNVSLFCLANPPIPGLDKPVSMLLRVKTAQDADQVVEKMEELRGTE